jgi:para-nitrobenzyl esterase
MLRIKYLVFIAVFLCAGCTRSVQSLTEVAVTGGRIQGRLMPKPGGAVFKGIPFAAPPVGDLRWRDPAPVKPWQGVRDAGAYGPPCSQIKGGWNDDVAAIAQEDCLYLNVWAPEWPAKPGKPVMFWIHGGGNVAGSGMGGANHGRPVLEAPFDGANLARYGVVVVTINYRLGVLGFFTHPELTEESPHHASGNYGLMDQIAALKWVQENIAKFGGDPGNITIFGQSAGAWDVSLLLTSPLSQGLFEKAVQLSGTAIIGDLIGKGMRTPAEADRIGQEYAAKLKAPANGGAIQYLRGLSAAEILAASPGYGQIGVGPDVPVLDGYVIPKRPIEVSAAGQEQSVPLITGNTAREMRLEGGPDDLKKAIHEEFGNLAPRALELYGLAGKPQASVYPPYGDANAQFMTDRLFRCPSVAVADWHSAAGHVVYEYEFSRALPWGTDGAVHAGDLLYVFGTWPEEPPPVDRKVAEAFQTYLTDFAKAGDPNGSGVPEWPRFDAKSQSYLEFTDDGSLVVKHGLRSSYCELFSEALKRKMARQ